MDRAREVLKQTFHFDDFKLSQAQVVERLIQDNANCLVLYPTGGGKSLCYQIPGICLPGLTLVISPLIALMKDQVDGLKKLGVAAASLDSSLSMEETRAVKDSIRDGTLKILYVAPERLNNEGFIEMLRPLEISLLAVDESHCISQWGSSFRPEYLKIARFAEEFKVERVLCLTATATRDVAKDICTSFHIDEEKGVFRIPVYRPNLSFLVKTAKDRHEKVTQIVSLLKDRTGPAIVYVTLQRQAEEVRNELRAMGVESDIYHAGLPADERKRVQDSFMSSEKSVVVATIAFGMGIDKNNIRVVVHLYMPKTLENYSQEVGRAGRDGKPSTCVMFLSAPDIPILEGFCRGDTCSKTSLQLWLGEVMNKEPDPDGAISFNQYDQQKTYDIRANVLGLFYASLELQHGLIRAVTPMYSVYDITPRTPAAERQMMGDSSFAGKAVVARLTRKRNGSGYTINVVEKADDHVPREVLASQITRWELDGLVEVKASQVRARFMVLKELPKSMKDQEAIAEVMYTQMLAREADAVTRLNKVVEFATKDDCLAQSLASYFGDDDAVPNLGMCGNCTFCITTDAVKFDRSSSSTADTVRLARILAVCRHRDDPRLLARLAFGIASPRLTDAKLTRSDEFGSMVDVDWNVLMEAFTKACDEGGNLPAQEEDEPTAGKKRAYTSSSSNRSSGGRGRGRGGRGASSASGSKRGRYS